MFHVKRCPRETYVRYKIINAKGTQRQKLISDYLSMCVYINYNDCIILGTAL